MDTPAFFLNIISALQLIAKSFWQQVTALLRTLYAPFDRFIDYLATHPLLDKFENTWRNLSGPIKQNRIYTKAALYAQLVRLDKPIGILLLLWPTLIALWIAAEGWPDPLVLFVFVSGVFLMRSAGCAINDYADRDIDGKVKRTTSSRN